MIQTSLPDLKVKGRRCSEVADELIRRDIKKKEN